MDKAHKLPPESEDEDRVIDLKKIKIKEPAPLDIDFFLNEIKNVKGKTSNHQKSKPRPKQEKLSTKDQQKAMIEVPLSDLKQYSLDMISTFKGILEEKFNGAIISELDKERRSNLERLFSYLCFGLQQCFEEKQFDVTNEIEISQISKICIGLLKKIAFKIDRQLLKAHNGGKKTSPSGKLKNQWNFLLEMIKDFGNHKFRCEIISKKIKPKQLAYANEADLKEYLSQERQKNLESEAQKIVRISENDDLKLHFEQKNESKDDCFDHQDELTTVLSELEERIEDFKEESLEKESKKRSEPKMKKGDALEAQKGKKARKLN